MTNKELKNEAYLIASGSFLSTEISFDEFIVIHEMTIKKLALKEFKKLNASELFVKIEKLADRIIFSFDDVVSE